VLSGYAKDDWSGICPHLPISPGDTVLVGTLCIFYILPAHNLYVPYIIYIQPILHIHNIYILYKDVGAGLGGLLMEIRSHHPAGVVSTALVAVDRPEVPSHHPSHPAPCTLYLAPCTLHPAPCTLRHPYTSLHLTPHLNPHT
jgi:hypothetical protein